MIYTNTTKIYRAPHDNKHHYLKISYNLLLDSRLTLDELGIMIKILKNSSPTHVLYMDKLKQECGLGADRFYKATKNLQKYGYLKKFSKQGSTRWLIYESPFTTKENTSCVNTPLTIKT
jgi:hypothetical protein